VIPLYDMGVKKAKPTFRLLLFQLLSSLQKSFQLSNEIFLYFRWNPNCYRSEMGNSCISRVYWVFLEREFLQLSMWTR